MIIDTAKKFNMLKSGDSVLCAVSGGADSMCLLHWLSANAESLGIRVVAAHYNHQLRGAESDRDEAFVAQWCKDRKIKCVTGRGDVKAFAEAESLGIEEAARKLRYEFLEKTAAALGANRVATAHNADDNAETVLMNLCRGSGARGLSGIPPVRGMFIRPLIETARSEIDEYLSQNGVPHVEDSTNGTDDYTRNRLRHRVMPELRGLNPAFSAAVGRMSAQLREDDACLTEMAESFIGENLRDNSLPADKLRVLPKAVSARVLRSMCGRGFTAAHADMVFALLDGEGLRHADINGMRVTKDSGRLYFGAEEATLSEYELSVGKTVYVSELGSEVTAELAGNAREVFNSLNTLYADYDSIVGNITLTPRRDGDRIRLSGRSCTKSLKDLFSEAKMNQRQRNLTPVIRDGEGIVGVFGFGVSERCRIKPGKPTLRIVIKCTGDN